MTLATIGRAVGALSRKQNGAVGATGRSTAACRPYSAAKRQLAILFPALLAATLALACTSDDEPPRTDGFYADVNFHSSYLTGPRLMATALPYCYNQASMQR